MYKLIILFEQPPDEEKFQENWQKFMGLAEKLPRLKREVVSRVQEVIYGAQEKPVVRIHELIFDSRTALEAALGSPEGKLAGQFLQTFTQGRVTIYTSEHMEGYEREFKTGKG